MSLALWSVLTAGCDDPESAEVEFRDDYTCPTWRCGFNSAEVNGRAIRELNLDGEPNSEGMQLLSFVAPAGLLGNYALDVENDELVARSGSSTLRGIQLLGATMVVKGPGLLSLPVTLTIAGYQEVDSWAAGAPKVATYALLYPDPLSLLAVKNICVGDLLDTLATSVTVLGGETYDLTNKTVQSGKSRWFTLACAGSAAAKMRLMNYGPQSDFDGLGNPATVAQRQATLKMITADYCGTGQSYTQNGTALEWENAGGTVIPGSSTPGAVEAVWTASGALCLDEQRLATAQVGCSLPACSAFGLDDGEWMTYVPAN